MNLKIDEELIKELGLGDLPDQDRKDLLKQIQETLEMRVGMKIAADLSESQLDEFEKFMDSKDEKGAMGWLGKNYPNYRDVVKTEMEKLKDEIKKDAPIIKRSVENSKQ